MNDNRPTRLYLAGPMTGMPDSNYPAFHHAADQLRDMGYLVENPAECSLPENSSWHDFMRSGVRQLINDAGLDPFAWRQGGIPAGTQLGHARVRAGSHFEERQGRGVNEELKRLLELAAKAIGGELSHGHAKVRTGDTWDEFEWRGSPGIRTPPGWKPYGGVTIHPQENDGDALRLAALQPLVDGGPFDLTDSPKSLVSNLKRILSEASAIAIVQAMRNP